eukprot:676581-Rhodomonas_salina.1
MSRSWFSTNCRCKRLVRPWQLICVVCDMGCCAARIVPTFGGPPLSLSSFATTAKNKLHRPRAAIIMERSGLAVRYPLSRSLALSPSLYP